jgi:hypothetical protein
LPLGENDNGVFFDIFIDFHNGAFDREDFALLDAKLKEFCIVCGKIESLTDRWPILEQEPSDEDKDKLHNLLGIFFSILPSREVLDEWIKTSIKKLPGSKY